MTHAREPHLLTPDAVSARRWIAALVNRTAQLGEEHSSALLSLLDTADRAHYERRVTASGRDSFLLGRSLLRTVLARTIPCRSQDLSFRISRNGKPMLARSSSGRPIYFNLAHCETHVLVGVSRHGELGVDIEAVRPNTARVARRFFRPEEVAVLESLPEQARTAAFFHLWAIKEACVKARGRTLASGLGTIAASLERQGRHQDLHWEIIDVSDNARAAIAVRAGARHEQLLPGAVWCVRQDAFVAELLGDAPGS